MVYQREIYEYSLRNPPLVQSAYKRIWRAKIFIPESLDITKCSV